MRCSTPTMCCAASTDVLDAPFAASGPCMHEALFSDKGLAEGFSTLDIAKGLIDEGYHPMTVYFPLVVHGAMLVEPTETESKAVLDQFIGALRSIALRAKKGDPALKTAPHFAPRARLDETLAARKPILAREELMAEPAPGLRPSRNALRRRVRRGRRAVRGRRDPRLAHRDHRLRPRRRAVGDDRGPPRVQLRLGLPLGARCSRSGSDLRPLSLRRGARRRRE